MRLISPKLLCLILSWAIVLAGCAGLSTLPLASAPPGAITQVEPKEAPAQVTVPRLQPTPTQANQAGQIDAQALQQRMGMEFIPADAHSQPAITQEQALATAYKYAPGLSKSASAVIIQLGYLSMPAALKAAQKGGDINMRYADMGLVWVVSFQGVKVESAGPPGGQPRSSSEWNVVINARTGDYIMQFTYR